MPKKKKKGGKKKKGKGGKKKGGKKKKGKKAPKVDVNEFDSTPYINVSTGELPLPLDVAARIAIRFRTSLDLVYTKILLDPEMFEQFFQITDLTERMENLVDDEQEEAEGMATTESKDMEINKNEKLPFMTKTAMKIKRQKNIQVLMKLRTMAKTHFHASIVIKSSLENKQC